MPEETIEVKLARIEKLANMGLKPAAAQLCRLVLEKDPQNVTALAWLARTSTLPDEAGRALERAVQLNPDDPAVKEAQAATAQAAAPAAAPSAVATAPANPYIPAYSPPAAPAVQPYPAPVAGGPPDNGMPFPQVNPQWSYSPNSGPASSYAYLQNLAAPVPPVPGVAPAPVAPAVRKQGGAGRALGLVLGLLLLFGGIVLAVFWSLNIQDYNSDLSRVASTLQGQITNIEGKGSNWKLTASVKGQPERSFAISEQMFKTLEPLIKDAKKDQALAPNSVNLNITPAGRLASIEVVSPSKGTATNSSNGLLGFGPVADWSLTVGGVLLALVGLLWLGRSLGRPKSV